MEVSRDETRIEIPLWNFKVFFSFLRQVVETLLTSGRACNPRTRDDPRTWRRRHGETPGDREGTLGGHPDTGNLSPTKRTTTRSYLWHFFSFLSTAGPEPLMTLEEEGRKGEVEEGKKG